MQIKETTNEGLKRAYALTIPASDIETKIDAEPATTYTSRPAATGANGDRVKTDC